MVVTTPLTRAELIIQQMQALIAQHGLQLMQSYANDLLTHDRRILDDLEDSSCTVGWCVGHSHTHMAVLGLHPEMNDMVNTYVRLAHEDRFYKLTLKQGKDFSLVEVKRADFPALSSTPVPYTKTGDGLDFTLHKAGTALAHVSIKMKMSENYRPSYHFSFRPLVKLNSVDKAALEMWADYTLRHNAGTMFYRTDGITWFKTPEEQQNARALLDQYDSSRKVASLYDKDEAFAQALSVLIPNFEYPCVSHMTLTELRRFIDRQ